MNSTTPITLRNTLAVALAAALAGCGGGHHAASKPVAPTPVASHPAETMPPAGNSSAATPLPMTAESATPHKDSAAAQFVSPKPGAGGATGATGAGGAAPTPQVVADQQSPHVGVYRGVHIVDVQRNDGRTYSVNVHLVFSFGEGNRIVGYVTNLPGVKDRETLSFDTTLPAGKRLVFTPLVDGRGQSPATLSLRFAENGTVTATLKTKLLDPNSVEFTMRPRTHGVELSACNKFETSRSWVAIGNEWRVGEPGYDPGNHGMDAWNMQLVPLAGGQMRLTGHHDDAEFNANLQPTPTPGLYRADTQLRIAQATTRVEGHLLVTDASSNNGAAGSDLLLTLAGVNHDAEFRIRTICSRNPVGQPAQQQQ